MTKQRYDLYLNTPILGIVHAADVVVIEEGASLQQVGFRYLADYLAKQDAFPVDPVQLPLTEGEKVLNCRGGAPAFLDDYLPDAWGRRVLARLALYRDNRHFNANSVIDSLALLSNSRIGAMSLVERGDNPIFDNGHALEEMAQAEQAAQHIDDVDYNTVDVDEMGLLYLANAGTGVGGARPKALLYDDHGQYLAKFNRKTQDPYNNARVELACLLMAKAAGLQVAAGKIISGINNREVLLLDRFDIMDNGRHHLITANGLLKEPTSQQDLGRAFRYDDVCGLLQKHSITIEKDLRQLVRLMLFNRAINNTDDHERNFSLIHRGDGYQLAPAYDLVPSVVIGEYHAAGFGYQPYPPKPSEASQLGKVFGLAKTVVADLAEEVIAALDNWREFAGEAGVREEDNQRLSRLFLAAPR